MTTITRVSVRQLVQLPAASVHYLDHPQLLATGARKAAALDRKSVV